MPDGSVNPIASLVCEIVAQFNAMERNLIRSRMAVGYENYREAGGMVGRREGFRKADLQYKKDYYKELYLL